MRKNMALRWTFPNNPGSKTAQLALELAIFDTNKSYEQVLWTDCFHNPARPVRSFYSFKASGRWKAVLNQPSTSGSRHSHCSRIEDRGSIDVLKMQVQLFSPLLMLTGVLPLWNLRANQIWESFLPWCRIPFIFIHTFTSKRYADWLMPTEGALWGNDW